MRSMAGESGVKMVGEGVRERERVVGLGMDAGGERWDGDGGDWRWWRWRWDGDLVGLVEGGVVGDVGETDLEDRRGDGLGEGVGEGSYMGGGTNEAFLVVDDPPASRAACRSEAYLSWNDLL
jgi:hypothetical protein